MYICSVPKNFLKTDTSKGHEHIQLLDHAIRKKNDSLCTSTKVFRNVVMVTAK